MSSDIHSTALSGLQPEQWLIERIRHASRELSDCVKVNPQKLSGVPVLKGSRISVAQILAEIGEGRTAAEVAADLELDASLVQRLVQGLAVCLDGPISR